MRIISLVPSLTELLIDLGLQDQLIGRTRFCIHPKEVVKSIAKIGGTKTVNIEKVKRLQPDLIIANKEENSLSDVKALEEFSKVYVTDIPNFEEALSAIITIGRLTEREKEATEMVSKIQSEFDHLAKSERTKNSACYLIWNNPLMTVGYDTFIHDMMRKCGFRNIFADMNRYPSISFEDIHNGRPDYILLSSEPFPFKEKHIAKFEKYCPDSKTILVDGEFFSWYGSRMLGAGEYFRKLRLEV